MHTAHMGRFNYSVVYVQLELPECRKIFDFLLFLLLSKSDRMHIRLSIYSGAHPCLLRMTQFSGLFMVQVRTSSDSCSFT